MFSRKSEPTLLEQNIDALLKQMLEEPDADEKAKLLDQVTKLSKLKEYDRKRVSPDTLVLVAGNLAGIILILSYEKANVLTSRALGFVMKLR